jgi:hypothetical protein
MKNLSAILCALLLPACLDGAPEVSTHTQTVDAPNAVTTWHANAQSLVGAFTGRGNAAQAYTAGLIQVAVYDAVVAIRGGYDPFIVDNVAAPAGADINAAIATAAYRVGITRVNVTPGDTARATYTSQYNTFMAGIPDSQAKTDGAAVGEAVAQAVLAARANDNFYNTGTYANPPADPGVWQSVAVTNDFATAGAADQQMRFVIPLTAATPDARRAPAPLNLHSHRYAVDFAETQSYGEKTSTTRTPAMTDSVQFWTESGFTLWSRNARNIVIANQLDEVESARALAAFGVATGDAMLACWDSKYHYMFWRPWQAIHRADEDGNRRTNPQAGWIPTVRANHPEYPAGHGCYGGAATAALKKVFGDGAYTLSSTGAQVVGWPVVPTRSYDSLRDIVEDTADARVWGGLHFRTTMDKSARWSKQVAKDAICGSFGIECPHFDGFQCE